MLILRVKKGRESAVLAGNPWVSASMLVESSEQALAEPGELAALRTLRDEPLGTGYFNAGAAIPFRLLTRGREAIDAGFFRSRLEQALAKREALLNVPYYRLVHAEADGLPGLTVDRFGDLCVLQLSTAGMERLQPLLLEALEAVLKPRAIVLRGDIPAREREGLAREVRVIKGDVPPLVEVHENGCLYLADVLRGQKTGWFHDQRDNRKLLAGLSAGKTMLDVYSHSGGFGLLAARHGAKVTLADSSALALDLAREAAGRGDVECDYLRGDAFEVMQAFARERRQFDVVMADPPAFVKTREHIANGMQGYERVTRLAAALVAPGGVLGVASCSHHATRPRFKAAVSAGLAGRNHRMLAFTGAAPDHPVHPHLPQSEYLKALFLRLD